MIGKVIINSPEAFIHLEKNAQEHKSTIFIMGDSGGLKAHKIATVDVRPLDTDADSSTSPGALKEPKEIASAIARRREPLCWYRRSAGGVYMNDGNPASLRVQSRYHHFGRGCLAKGRFGIHFIKHCTQFQVLRSGRCSVLDC